MKKHQNPTHSKEWERPAIIFHPLGIMGLEDASFRDWSSWIDGHSHEAVKHDKIQKTPHAILASYVWDKCQKASWTKYIQTSTILPTIVANAIRHIHKKEETLAARVKHPWPLSFAKVSAGCSQRAAQVSQKAFLTGLVGQIEACCPGSNALLLRKIVSSQHNYTILCIYCIYIYTHM